ncbi:MAG: hypothetical protein C0421_01765 [Hyphomonas sp.]|nr:hypothetical protein [Hyphomonas sp.]
MGLIALVVGALWHVSSYNQNQREHREKAASYQLAERDGFSECELGTTEFNRTACIARKVYGEQEQERGRADLHAQQDMSTWALSLLWASGIGIVISGLGIYLLWQTLKDTQTALSQTAAATDAAKVANAIAEKMGQRQTRAYVFAVDFLIDAIEAGKPVTITFLVKNFGQSPASKVWHKYALSISDVNMKIRKFTDKAVESDAVFSLPPGHQFETQFKTEHPLKPIEMEGLLSGELRLVLRGFVTYKDIFGKRRYSTFMYILNTKMPKGHRLIMTNKHNRAN